MKTSKQEDLIISYMTLRRALGLLGMAFPIVLAIGSILFSNCTELQQSISAYYHTIMRDVFVGVLCAFALFLYTYRGYEKPYHLDNILTNVAGLFALGIAVFPPKVPEDTPGCSVPLDFNIPASYIIHLTCAFLFFLTLAIISIFLFTKTKDKEDVSIQKKKRNIVFRTSGLIMIHCIIFIFIYMMWVKGNVPKLDAIKPIFWLEALALWAFGFSWLVKGELLWPDPES